MLTRARAQQIVALALGGIRREYPCKPGHVLTAEVDIGSPRSQTPSFYGCFDWHSAVHAHWTLARVLHRYPGEAWADEARAQLQESLRPEPLRAELSFRQSRPRFEMPYGVAWLLALQSVLDTEWPEADWGHGLRALSQLASEHFVGWLALLPCPTRGGEHSQSAFSMGLALDAARSSGRDNHVALLVARAREFYAADRDAPLRYEPSAHDFLSPCLAEADLLTRVFPTDEFEEWFDGFWPEAARLVPANTTDRSNGKLTHWDGLNLSRAWMLARISDHLPTGHRARARLYESARAHLEKGLEGLKSGHYAGTHWLGTFATYALTEVSWARAKQC